MPRVVTFEVPVDPTLFGPNQLRPRAILGMATSGVGRWLVSHVAPYPALAAEHRTGFVVSSLRLDYADPQLRYDEATWLAATVGLTIDSTGERVRFRISYAGDGRPAAELNGELRVLALTGDEGLTALPGALPLDLVARFQADEIHPFSGRVAVPPITTDELMEPREYTTTLSRSHCEVADQWSFIEMAELMTRAREQIYITTPSPSAAVRLAASAVVRRTSIVLMRPLFVFDECVITTSAARSSTDPGEVVFRHVLRRRSETTTCVITWEVVRSAD